jgi:hypothetical protein
MMMEGCINSPSVFVALFQGVVKVIRLNSAIASNLRCI